MITSEDIQELEDLRDTLNRITQRSFDYGGITYCNEIVLLDKVINEFKTN